MDDKYRIKRHPDALAKWWLYAPGNTDALGSYFTHDRAVFVMDAHARGADCDRFLLGHCNCRTECGR